MDVTGPVMNRVKILPPEVAGKIAAGEVIERPASAAKELVENAIDAGATHVTVAIEEGGKKLIRVEDDGCGMSRADAVLAFERHATSKIGAADDLLRISTLGFRGEALPSIAEIARTQLWTCDLSADAGTYLRIAGGNVERVEDTARPRGTTLQVEDLFYNFPARAKFMKTAGGEAGHVAHMIDQAALVNPRVAFRFTSNGRKQMQCEAVDTFGRRIAQVLGDRLDLLEFEEVSGPFIWHGFISPPLDRPAVGKPVQYLFVNGRPVRDRTILFALRRAYQEYLQKDTNPTAILYLRVDPAVIDVNVHPTKAEIKFLDSSDAFKSLMSAVKRRLGKLQTFVAVHLNEDPSALADRGSLPPVPIAMPRLGDLPVAPRATAPSGPLASAPQQIPLQPIRSLKDEPFTILGQYMNSFIIVGASDGVLVIDQHNAHERALYEEYCGRLERLPSQQFLLPPVIDVASDEAFALIVGQAEKLSAHGLTIEEAGPRSIMIREAPAQLGESGAIAFLGEMVRTAEGTGGRDFKDFVEFHLLRSMACHSAIKINTPLTSEKMERIVRELFATSTPMVCPHGRPIIVKLRLDEILRGLRRKSEDSGIA